MRKINFIEECYEQLNSVKTDYDVYQFLKRLAGEFQFERFAVLLVPNRLASNLADHFLISNWPPEMVRAYDEMKLLNNSPVIAALRLSADPMEWKISDVRKMRGGQDGEKVYQLFTAFEMTHGVFFSTYNSTGRQGAVSFAGEREALRSDELATLHLLSLYVYNHISAVLENDEGNAPALSARETECLQWAAKGKTNPEIATILSISVNTVSGYMTAICQKLNANNKTHSVAKAFELGLFR